MKIGMLTSGGDCQGLNSALRGVAKTLYSELGNKVTIYGIRDGYRGLIEGDYHVMSPKDFSDILTLGGTILGTSRQPFKEMQKAEEDSEETRLEKMLKTVRDEGFDCLVILGGNGTHKTANLLSQNGVNVVTLPKTIDNDLWGTDMTFGFQSAVDIATHVLDCIHTTATSHGRVFIVEIMGHKVGWIPLYAGVAGGADVILIPEIPFSVDAVCSFLSARVQAGERYTMVAVAEGALLDSEARFKKEDRAFVRTELGESTVTRHLAEVIGERTGVETRYSVLGYLQRGGAPCAYDRLLCSRMGGYAARLAAEGRFGVTVALEDNKITFNALTDVAGKYKFVDPAGETVRFAREIGISFGDNP